MLCRKAIPAAALNRFWKCNLSLLSAAPTQSFELTFITWFVKLYVIIYKRLPGILVNLIFPVSILHKWPWRVHDLFNLSYCCGVNLNHAYFELVVKTWMSQGSSRHRRPASPLSSTLLLFAICMRPKRCAFVKATKNILMKIETLISNSHCVKLCRKSLTEMRCRRNEKRSH